MGWLVGGMVLDGLVGWWIGWLVCGWFSWSLGWSVGWLVVGCSLEGCLWLVVCRW